MTGMAKRPLSDAYSRGGGKSLKPRTMPPPRQMLPDLLQQGGPKASRLAPDAELCAAYTGRVVRDLEDRVLTDPDYSAEQFPYTAQLLARLATQRGADINATQPGEDQEEEDIYS